MSEFRSGSHHQHHFGGSRSNGIDLVLAEGDKSEFPIFRDILNAGGRFNYVIYRQMNGTIPQNQTEVEDLAVKEARAFVQRVKEMRAATNYHWPNLWGICTNEPIQESFAGKPSQGAYINIGRYQAAWMREVRRLDPTIKLLLCIDQGWFGGDGPDFVFNGYVGFQFYAEAAELCDGFSIHGYWNPVPPGKGDWWKDYPESTPLELRVPDGGADSIPGDMDFGERFVPHGVWHALRPWRPPNFKDDYEGILQRDPGGAYHNICAAHPTKPIFMTETNGGGGDDHTGIDYRKSDMIARDFEYYVQEILRLDTRRQVLGICWFVTSTSDERHVAFLPISGLLKEKIQNTWTRLEPIPHPPEPPIEPEEPVSDLRPNDAEAHSIWDSTFRASGGPGYNPDAALHKVLPSGAVPIGPEIDVINGGVIKWRIQPTGVGVAIAEFNNWGNAWFAPDLEAITRPKA